MAPEKSPLEQQIFELATFLVVSARSCLDDPPSYGPMRLTQALGRLVKLMEEVPGSHADPFLRLVKEKVEKRDWLVTSVGIDGFTKFLDSLVSDFVQEAKAREKDVYQHVRQPKTVTTSALEPTKSMRKQAAEQSEPRVSDKLRGGRTYENSNR